MSGRRRLPVVSQTAPRARPVPRRVALMMVWATGLAAALALSWVHLRARVLTLSRALVLLHSLVLSLVLVLAHLGARLLARLLPLVLALVLALVRPLVRPLSLTVAARASLLVAVYSA